MKTSPLGIFVFVLGLAAVCWVGLGYLGSNLPALLVTLLIAALYLCAVMLVHLALDKSSLKGTEI